MKKTRMTAIVLITVLLLTAVLPGCTAESIFAPIATEEPQAAGLTAPSYGGMANVEPDLVEESAAGGTIVTYLNVQPSGYNDFGIYLGGLGFYVIGVEEQESRTAYAVTDGKVDFVMIYDRAEYTMQLVYPQGTDFERSQFPGYTRIEMGKEITIPGLGIFTFNDFAINTKIRRASRFSEYFSDVMGFGSEKELNCYLTFTFYNSTDSAKQYFYDPNDLLEATMVYRNDDAEYVYAEDSHGRYRADLGIFATGLAQKKNEYFRLDNSPTEPLGTTEMVMGFDLPERVAQSTDGFIAIRLDFKTGEKYILILRENGTDQPAGADQ